MFPFRKVIDHIVSKRPLVEFLILELVTSHLNRLINIYFNFFAFGSDLVVYYVQSITKKKKMSAPGPLDTTTATMLFTIAFSHKTVPLDCR